MGLWNRYTHAHITRHRILCVCVVFFFFWLFLRLGTKLLSKISQWTLLLFLRTEKGKVRKEPRLSSFPSPLTAQTQNTHSEDGAEVAKVKKMGPCLFTGSVRNYCGAAAVLRAPSEALPAVDVGEGGWDTGRQGVWGVTSNIFCTSRKMGFVS